MFKPDNTLPISAILPQITTALSTADSLVIEAPPGAGKTTAVPLALLGAPWLQGRKIVMLEPRRIAARAAAERMAELLGEPVGATVGYSIRLESKVSTKTRIEVVTEGVLTRRLQRDPALSDCAAVIFDEFHERSIHSDLGLALCLQSREIFRSTDQALKLLVMSATLDAGPVASRLNAQRIKSEGRSHPVTIHYASTSVAQKAVVEKTIEQTREVLQTRRGNILVFLPGQREIRAVMQGLQRWVDERTALLPLYGALPFNEQRKAISALPANGPYQRKVVLSTDLAETSLTIEGVNVVIDSGFARQARFDARTGMTRLHTRRISRASSEQRAGRAGRLAAGECFRLWSETQQSQLVAYSAAEILTSDLCPLALQLLQWGVDDPDELCWLDTPPNNHYQQAIELLDKLDACTRSNGVLTLTPHGEQMAALGTDPRLAHMLLIADEHGLQTEAANIAALMSERIPLPQTDIDYALEALAGAVTVKQNQRGWLQRTRQQAQQFRRTLADSRHKADLPVTDRSGFLLACAFPDRIARKREHARNQYLLSNGRSATLPEDDSLAGCEWLAVAELGGESGQREDRIYRAAPLNPALFADALKHLCKEENLIEWQQDKCLAEKQTRVGSLVLRREALSNIDDSVVTPALIERIRTTALRCLPWTPALEQWQARVLLLRETFPSADPPWPDVSSARLAETLDTWLAPFLSGIRSESALQSLPLKQCLQALLSWPQPKLLEELAPERITVPSGSSYAIDYQQSPPVLQVKLQEMFGCQETPSVAEGRVQLLVHLLSPARRPLQITRDMPGFWQNSYPDIKKEMKGRYPKHPWPDDPIMAEATRATKNRKPNTR